MTNAELIAKIKAEIKRQISDLPDTWSGSPAAKWAFEELLSFLDTLESEKPVPNDLEEAAGGWYEKCPFPKSTWWDEGREMKLTDSRETFIAGAKWQRKQMVKNAIPCKVFWYDGPLLDYTQEQQDNALERIGAHIGDKVRIIIVKED